MGRSAHTPRDTGDETTAELMTDPHCRYIMAYLSDNDGRATVGALAAYVVSEETDTPAAHVPGDSVRRVQTWLHHGQLPALADHGIVGFDPDTGTVESRVSVAALQHRRHGSADRLE
jgi:hypothetical protein